MKKAGLPTAPRWARPSPSDAARPGRAATVSVTDVLCPAGRCDAVQDGRVVRVDGVHVTAAFSRVLAPVLTARVDRALAG